ALASGEEISAPLVISTADPVRTFLKMIDTVWLDPEFMLAVKNIRLRGCTGVVQYALDRLPEAPALANAQQALAGVVGLTSEMDALEKAYDASKYGTVSEKPHVDVTVQTLRWPGLAPSGKHVLVAKAQFAPYKLRDNGTWDDARSKAFGDSVTAA